MTPKTNRPSMALIIICVMMLPALNVILPLGPANAAGNALLSFSPAQSLVDFPQPVTVNVTLGNVVNLESWQIKVAFNSSVLAFSSVTIPSDDLLGPSGNWLQPPLVINSTTGYVIIYLSLDAGQGVNGSGTLCQITFNATQSGMSQLTFANLGIPGPNGGTVLLDSNGSQISFDHPSGSVQVSSGPTAKFTWIPSKPSVNVTTIFDASSSSAGWSSNISGFAPITSYTWNFGDGTPINTTSKSTIQHVYSLTGNYSVALTVTDSTSRTNMTSQLVQAIIRSKPWDLDGDGKVTDMKDVAVVAKAFGSKPGSSNWNPIADLSGPTPGVPDGKVDMRDIALVTKHFGQAE